MQDAIGCGSIIPAVYKNCLGANTISEFEKLMQHLGLENSPMYENYREMAILRELKKHERFYDTVDKSRYIYFLVSRVLRGFLIDKKGNDFTDCFIFRYGQAHIGCIDIGKQNIASECAEAIVDSQLICFDINKLMPYILSSLELSNLYSRKLMESYSEHWVHKNILFHSTAMERYQWFLGAYPGLIDIVPHKYIASFLTMSPVTLSRIRRADKH